jgi:putative glycosyltransferase (TIGR04372 family)
MNFKRIKIGALKESIGHGVYNPTIYFADVAKDQLTIIVYPKKKSHNYPSVEILIQKLSETHRIKIINSNILFWIMLKIINYGIVKMPIIKNFYANIYYAHRSPNNINYGSIYEMNNQRTLMPKCEVSKDDDLVFKDWRLNKGIKEKYVCVFSRNSSYYDEAFKDPRNSNFLDLIPTIKMLKSKGFDIVRVGRNHKDIFNKKSTDLYFDYDSFGEKNKLIDVLLIKNCYFFLTTNSGINALAFMFHKRILYYNMFPFGMRPFFKNCSYIMKKYKKDNKILNFSEIPEKMLLQEDYSIIEKMNYQIVNNSPDEIKEFVANQLESNFKDIILPPKNNYIYGNHSYLDKQWYTKNYKLFDK